jgi:UDP-N-acetylmuramoyl-tripeptide--D-alanyl-D-alanine ligase
MMLLGSLAKATGGWVSDESAERVVDSATIDSRSTSRGSLFFALRGSNTDGHNFVDRVLENGGMAVVSSGERREGIILVQSVEEALLDAARWRRGSIGSRVIAITGSCGKTTTRRLLAAALECRYSVYCTKGNLNNHLGMPLTILNTPEEDPDVIILEIGMNHAGELLMLGEIASPTDCLVTNIGRAHMEFFDSIDDIARAKAELIRTTSPGGICVIPADEPILTAAAHDRGLQVRYFGDGGDAWFEEDSGTFTACPWRRELKLQLEGHHNMMNALSAILMADSCNVESECSMKAVERVTPLGGRGRIVRAGSITVLDESYNANPDSTAACLDVLQDMSGSRGVVLGDMRELGDSAPDFHREILRKADGIGLDFIIITGEMYASVIESVVRTEVHKAVDWQDALRILRGIEPSDCTVLVKGSNSLKLGELVRSLEEGI